MPTARLLNTLLGIACAGCFALTTNAAIAAGYGGNSDTKSEAKAAKKADKKTTTKAPKKAKAEKKEKSKEKTDKALPKSCSGLKNKIADEKDAQRYPTDVKKAAERDQFINRMESKLSRECK